MRPPLGLRRLKGQATAPLLYGLIAVGCSVLYDTKAIQCKESTDCRRLGGNQSYRCEANVCVLRSDGSGGEGGYAGSSGCTSNAQCISDNYGLAYACVAGRCVALETEECPLLIAGDGSDHLKYLRNDSAILIGAFAGIAASNPTQSVSGFNYRLALEEFNQQGLPNPGSGSRPFVLVGCQGDWPSDSALEASVTHLVAELGVAGILATFKESQDFLDAFELAREVRPTFFLSPRSASLALATQADDGLMWHLLGADADYAGPIAPLMERAEALMNRKRAAFPSDTGPLRVAAIESERPQMIEITDRTLATIRFNGLTGPENQEAGHLERARVQPLSEQVPNPDVSAALSLLPPNGSFAPHIIIANAGGEFAHGIIGAVEDGWPSTVPPPLYLMGWGLYDNAGLLVEVRARPGLEQRILGVTAAANPDRDLYLEYLSRLDARFPDTAGIILDGTENFYDAAYHLFYAYAAAGSRSDNYRGDLLEAGMLRIIEEGYTDATCTASAPCAEVGPGDALTAGLSKLTVSSSRISLIGTMGPPNFDVTTGVRGVKTSVWCIGDDGDGLGFRPDVMLYEEDTDTLVEDGTPCVPNF